MLANHCHRFLIAEQLEEIGARAKNIVLEPVSRNTGPSACIAALIAARHDPDALVLLAPLDHIIADQAAFLRAVEAALPAAAKGALVTFRVEPDCPHTGYGYIETEGAEGAAGKVRRFVEKPAREAAERYLDQGGYLWNAGIFLFKAKTMLGLIKTHALPILDACRKALAEMTEDLTFHVLGEAYREAPAISLDYAVAEKASGMVCVKLGSA